MHNNRPSRNRTAARAAVQAAWRREHAAGQYSPPAELCLDLDTLPLAELHALAARIGQRIADRDPALPHGWQWAGRWWGCRPDGRKTAVRATRADALRAMRAQQVLPLFSEEA